MRSAILRLHKFPDCGTNIWVHFLSFSPTAGASGLDEEVRVGLGRIRETLQSLPSNAYVLRYGPPPRPFAA